MSSVLRRSVALATCLLLAAGCTGEPEIVEALPGTERVGGPTEDLVEETTTTADLLTTAPSTTAGSTTVAPTIVLEDEAAVGIGSAFVAALRLANETGDFSIAAQMWTGYPDGEDDRAGHLAKLIAAHPWLLEGELSFEAFDSWAFQPQWALAIVVIADPERTSVATLLLDRAGVIQRIDNAATGTVRSITIEGDAAVIDGLPLEGSALAYLDGVLLDEAVVDHVNLTTTFALPLATDGPQILVASFATPEFPFTLAFVIERS